MLKLSLGFVLKESRVLHESVRSSAWGLAIHKQSRLIAVGSNLHEITVFALACHESQEHEDENDEIQPIDANDPKETAHRSSPSSFPIQGPEWVITSCLVASLSNIRVQLGLPREGHNIPSLDFTSDKEGNASTVLAADIRGNLVRPHNSFQSSHHTILS